MAGAAEHGELEKFPAGVEAGRGLLLSQTWEPTSGNFHGGHGIEPVDGDFRRATTGVTGNRGLKR